MYTQTISVNIRIAGPQDVQIDTHGGGGPGTYVSITSGGVVVYCYDTSSVRTYCEAWLSCVDLATHLPTDTNPESVILPGPGVVIRAAGRDEIRTVLSPSPAELRIRIGRAVWIVQDRIAHADMADAWRTVREIASLTLERRSPAVPPRSTGRKSRS